MYLIRDRRSSSVRQQRVFSRAYVMMADFEKLQAFASAFDGHVFRGKDGESVTRLGLRKCSCDVCLCCRIRASGRGRVCTVAKDSESEE